VNRGRAPWFPEPPHPEKPQERGAAMFLSQTWSPKDDLPTVDVFLNVLVAQLCVDIDQENHPERQSGMDSSTNWDENEP